VQAVLAEWRTAAVGARVRATLGLLEAVTLRPGAIRADVVDAVRAAGVSDAAIMDALYVCFAFNLIDRLADAFGWHVLGREEFDRNAGFVLRFGYRLVAPVSWRALRRR
jgi:alkylhydroperoxidase family enzyme